MEKTVRELKNIMLETGFHDVGTVNIASLQYDPEIRKICEGKCAGTMEPRGHVLPQ